MPPVLRSKLGYRACSSIEFLESGPTIQNKSSPKNGLRCCLSVAQRPTPRGCGWLGRNTHTVIGLDSATSVSATLLPNSRKSGQSNYVRGDVDHVIGAQPS